MDKRYKHLNGEEHGVILVERLCRGLMPESAGSYVSENKYLISLYIFRHLFSGLAGKTVSRK